MKRVPCRYCRREIVFVESFTVNGKPLPFEEVGRPYTITIGASGWDARKLDTIPENTAYYILHTRVCSGHRKKGNE